MHFIKIVFIILFLTNININAQETLPFEIEADNIKVENKTNNLFTSGNVIIKYKTYIINSDEAIYYKNNNQLLFNGNISISDKQSNSLTAQTLKIDLLTETGTATLGVIRTHNNYLITADTIELKDEEFLLKKCTLTTCTSTKPEWFIESEKLSVQKKNNVINSTKNKLFFYQIPIFYVPTYSQSISDKTISNKPTPEFGQNQIDGTYFNIYLGYLINDEISGKAGIGTSVNRGFRYGATHTYKPTKNQAFILKTYDVEETNFEGGISYRWKKNNETLDFQPIVASLYIPTENNKIETYLNADYLYDNINYNELYHAIPNVEFGIENINFYFSSKLSGKLGTGYFLDRNYETNRNQFLLGLSKTIVEFSEKSNISQAMTLKYNYYKDNTLYWKRLYNTVSLKVPILNSNHIFSYTKLFYESGSSPFVFDIINEITDDEFSTNSDFIFLPIILNLETNYQINKESYRNFKYTASYVFQCWQFDVSIDTIWNEVSYGISIPDITNLF